MPWYSTAALCVLAAAPLPGAVNLSSSDANGDLRLRGSIDHIVRTKKPGHKSCGWAHQRPPAWSAQLVRCLAALFITTISSARAKRFILTVSYVNER